MKKWNKGKTLGAKHKEFQWNYDKNKGLTIKRTFKNGDNTTTFTNEEIEKILNYTFKSTEVNLANNVSKLKNNTGKEGLGKFVYEKLDRNEVDAQSVSQLAAIFIDLNIFDYNKKIKNMAFWLENINWMNRLNS